LPKRGITIDYIGGAEGLTFKDPAVQAGINKAFITENDKKVAIEEKFAQETRNAKNVGMAIAARQAAEEFAKAKEAQIAKVRLDIDMIRANAYLAAANKWDGKLPEKNHSARKQLLISRGGRNRS